MLSELRESECNDMDLVWSGLKRPSKYSLEGRGGGFLYPCRTHASWNLGPEAWASDMPSTGRIPNHPHVRSLALLPMHGTRWGPACRGGRESKETIRVMAGKD